MRSMRSTHAHGMLKTSVPPPVMSASLECGTTAKLGPGFKELMRSPVPPMIEYQNQQDLQHQEVVPQDGESVLVSGSSASQASSLHYQRDLYMDHRRDYKHHLKRSEETGSSSPGRPVVGGKFDHVKGCGNHDERGVCRVAADRSPSRTRGMQRQRSPSRAGTGTHAISQVVANGDLIIDPGLRQGGGRGGDRGGGRGISSSQVSTSRVGIRSGVDANPVAAANRAGAHNRPLVAKASRGGRQEKTATTEILGRRSRRVVDWDVEKSL